MELDQSAVRSIHQQYQGSVAPVIKSLISHKMGRKRKVLKKKIDMEILQILFYFWFSVQIVGSETSLVREAHCPKHQRLSIGVVVDESSRVGREQKIAMELAVQDFDHHCCLNLVYSPRSRASAAASAIDLISHRQLDAIVGTITMQEAALASEFSTGKSIPIISLSPASSDQPQMAKMPSFIQVSTPITYQMQCVAALIGHFRWRKAILINEQGNSFSEESRLITDLSDSLHDFGSSVEHHVAFPQVSSLLNPKAFVEKELKKLRSKNVRTFILMQSSLEFSVVLFQKAKELGMMGKGYVWILSAEITNLLDSVNSSVILNMQGVIGLKTEFEENTDFVKTYKSRFRRKYGSYYSAEEENPEPSIYSFEAYTLINSLAMASHGSQVKTISFVNHMSFSIFKGLNGKISFKRRVLSKKPVFWIVNVNGRSYKKVAVWVPGLGFAENCIELHGKMMSIGSHLTGKMSSIYWPGGEQGIPKGWSIGSIEAPLKIGVPTGSAFPQYVQVTYDQTSNKSIVSGFSVKVFEAAVKELPYDLHFKYVPVDGKYDNMLVAVLNKSLDGAVGETVTSTFWYTFVDFSLPYMGSGVVMVVPVKQELKQSKFIALKVFTGEMWIQLAAMSLCTGVIVWLCEYAWGNEQFIKKSIPELIHSILWLSVTVISFSQRETIRSTASKLVLGVWICIVFFVGASFTAILSSMMTVPRLQGGPGIDYLRDTNAAIGCNLNSFLDHYLVKSLKFKEVNIHKYHSVDDYPKAFENGEIHAAFFLMAHAKVFLAKNCKGYTISGPSYQLGGSAFVFQKGSPLVHDISEAVLKITESGDINELERNMLQECNCSSSAMGRDNTDDFRLGPEPFSALFQVLAGIIGFAFITSMIQLLRKKWIHESLQETLLMKGICAQMLFVLTKCHARFCSRFQQKKRAEMNVPCDKMDLNSLSNQLPAVNNG